MGDFNQDGKLDIISKGYQKMSLFLGNGDGSFTPSITYPYWSLVVEMITGDFNNDGKIDLILLQTPVPGGQINFGVALYFLAGNGDGTFKTPRLIGTYATSQLCVGGGLQGDVQLTDVNGDGKLDVAFCDQSRVGILLGNGDGTFQPTTFYTVGSNRGFQFAFGDLNSVAKTDLLVSSYQGSSTQFQIYLGNGDGTFQSPQVSNQVSAYFGFVLGDFNANGFVDFMAPSGLGMQAYIQ